MPREAASNTMAPTVTVPPISPVNRTMPPLSPSAAGGNDGGDVKKTKTVGLVPMKIHSSRVPYKNIRFFNGKPLFWHIVNTLLQVEYFDYIVIDTDSDIIIDMVHKYFPGEDGKRLRTHMRP